MEVETVLDNAAATGADLESDVVVFHTPSAGRSKKGLVLVLLIAILAAIAIGIAVGTDNDVTADPPAIRTTAIQEATPVEQDQIPKEVVNVDAPKPAPPKKEDVATMTPTYTSSHGGTVTVSTETSSPPTVPDRDDRRSMMIKSPTWRG